LLYNNNKCVFFMDFFIKIIDQICDDENKKFLNILLI
jgi:hypothetical protein